MLLQDSYGRPLLYAEDALGHLHKESGPGGGQFVSKGGEGGSSDVQDSSGEPIKPKRAKKEKAAPVESGPPKSVGETFATMPVGKGTSKEAKAWRKANQGRYDSDPKFKALCDAVALFTQGDYNVQRAFAEKAVTGDLPEQWKDSNLPTWSDRPLVGNPMASYNTYFDGQSFDFENKTNATYAEAGRAFAEAINEAPPVNQPLFRGVTGGKVLREVAELKPGDNFDLLGPSSFSIDEQVASQFARGEGGGNRAAAGKKPFGVLIEVLPGTKGIPVSALSPWDQKEIVTSGRFVVERVDVEKDFLGVKRQIAKLVLRQVNTWEPK